MPEIGHKRYAELARKLLSLTGEEAAVELEYKLGMYLALQERPDWALLQDEYLTVADRVGGNTAGLFTGVGISNPANSGILCTVELMVATGTTGVQCVVFKNSTSLENSSAAIETRDQRLEGVAVAKIMTCRIVERRDAALGGGGVRVFSGPSATDFVLRPGHGPFPWVLDPGKNLMIYKAVVNEPITVSFIARERPIERYEARR
jgi:hypothetical protein